MVVDPDGYDHYVFSVSDDRFEVVGGQLRLKPGMALDRESEKFVSLSLRVYDAGAQISSEAKLTTSLEILDANDPPEAIVLERLEVPLGITGAVVGVMDVIDQDILDLYSFAVSDSRFEMDGNVLRLRADQKLMPADGSAIPILVTAQDPNGVTITQSFTVNVVNDVPGQNPVNPLDVDNDGHVSPRDALVLINVLNDKGPHAIEPLASVGEGDGIGPSVFIDVNGDGMLTALDVLLLINQLNNPGGMRAAPEGESAPLVVSKAEPLGLLPNQSAMDTMVNWQVWADPAWAGRGDGMPSSLVGHPNSGDIFALADSSVIDAEIESLLESLSREGLR